MHLPLILLVVFLVANLVDLVSTYIGLKSGQLSEGNGIAAWLFDRLGPMPTMVGMKLLMAALGVVLEQTGTAFGTVLLGGLTAVGVGVAINNIRLIRKYA